MCLGDRTQAQSTAWSPPGRYGQTAPCKRYNFSISDLPGTLFSPTHFPFIPPLPHSLPRSLRKPNSLVRGPSLLSHPLPLPVLGSGVLAGRGGWEAPRPEPQLLAPTLPQPAAHTGFWAGALRAGQGCLASLSFLPQELALRTNHRSSPTHQCSSEQFPGRIHWVSRKMFPVVFSFHGCNSLLSICHN